MKEHYLFVEKYRPDTLEGFVGNDKLKGIIESYITQRDIPNLLFAGVQGSGKTTLAKLLVKEIGSDYIYINASDENNIETVRTKIKNFASSLSFNGTKVIILDESDFLSPNSMAALRGIIEQYSATTRFIFTCNYVNKLIPALQSRLQSFEIETMSKADVARRADFILKNEGIQYDVKDLKKIIDLYFPDIRKVINELQKNSKNGKLEILEDSLISTDYKFQVLDVLKSKSNKKEKFNSIRKVISENSVKDFSSLYTFLYSTIDDYSVDITNTIVTLQQHQYQDSFSIDKEICFMSCVSQIIGDK